MARPPKNAEGPSATERMESAFWDCMGEMPFSEITVRDIVGRAKVNRNSYYYHYDSMWDLAQAAIEHAKFAALARVLLGDSPASDEDDTDVAASQAEVGFDHLRMLAGENGNQRLLEDAKRAVVNEWLGLFGLDAATLPDELRSSIDFVFGGVTALLAAWPVRRLGRIRVDGRGFRTALDEHRHAARRTRPTGTRERSGRRVSYT